MPGVGHILLQRPRHLDARHPPAPYPGVSYECWSINYTRADGTKMSAMAQSCGAEDYAWSSEATVVTLIREVIGYREHVDGFVLRPNLPSAWFTGINDGTYSILNVYHRGVRFDIHYTINARKLRKYCSSSARG